MEYYNDIKKPSKKEQIAAMESYNALAATLQELHSENPEIELRTDGKINTFKLNF